MLLVEARLEAVEALKKIGKKGEKFLKKIMVSK